MDGQSLDVTAEKIAQLRAIFPEVFSENKIDFARLKAILGESVVFPNEHYELNWAGKAEARKEIQKQTTATLIPDKGNSVDFDAAGNIFIEGENLEVLRVLQKSYFGKVKMIYIDPPYNTGNDSFVYPDDYAERQADYNKRTGITNGDGDLNGQDLWRKNTRENGQFHSVWLSMMYPRLYLARNLLREDGVIFVSIDSNEVANLRLLLDEIFGEENFIEEFIWRSRQGKGGTAAETATVHEYILCYARNIQEIQIKQQERVSLGGKERLRQWGQGDKREDRRSMFYPIYTPSGDEVFPIKPDGTEGRWRIGKKEMEKLFADQRIVFEKREDGRWEAYKVIPQGHKTYSAVDSILSPETGTTANGSIVVKDLFRAGVFDYAKPPTLVRYLIELANGDTDAIILDFFAGSGTTAQAVLELNEENGNGNQRFILVQIPERLEENSEAYKAGYRTIADICKARIQKVIAKLQTKRAAELGLNGNQQLLGFQAFRLAPSNFKQWRGDVEGAEAILQQLEAFRHSEKENSEAEKMLYELLLKAGYPLTAKVESAEIDGQAVYMVEDGKILVFFDDYTPAINAYVHKQKPQRVVCLDRVFKGNDEAVTNFKLQLKEAGIELKII